LHSHKSFPEVSCIRIKYPAKNNYLVELNETVNEL
jgi:hypothetical protein